jgi:hypothetical protein
MQDISKYMNNTTDVIRDENKGLMNIGITFINNQVVGAISTTPRREINIIIDFIDGVVDDKNVGSINCSYLSEYLGNELEILTRSGTFKGFSNTEKIKKPNDWRLDKNRMLFSVEKSGYKSATNASNLATAQNINVGNALQQPPVNSGQINADRLFANKTAPTAISNIDALNSDFIPLINKDEKISKAIIAYNISSGKVGGQDIDINNLLSYLINNNEKFKKIFVDTKETSVQEKIIDAEGDIRTNKEKLEVNIKNNSRIQTPEEADKKDRQLKLYELYLLICEIMKNNANQLVKMQRGSGKHTMRKKNQLSKTHKRARY